MATNEQHAVDRPGIVLRWLTVYLLGDRGIDAEQGSVKDITIREFQELINVMYTSKDVARGVDGTFMWLIEEIGELAGALREGTAQDKMSEFADVLAWLTTIANVAEVDLTAAVRAKYGSGCPGCGQMVCTCEHEKP